MTLEAAAYYFPGWHVDPKIEKWHGRGWTEWQVVQNAQPRFHGHHQPRVPSWGYFDEADPVWATRQAATARSAGITAFLFDWYWYDGPFLNRALDEGFLCADRHGMKFAIMWANHDWKNIHPAQAFGPPATLLDGRCTWNQFERMTAELVDRYLCHPDYLRIGGLPYFSIYELGTLIEALGSVDGAARGLAYLRQAAQARGLPGVHINVIITDVGLLPGEQRLDGRARIIERLGVDSVGSYVWMHHYQPGQEAFPQDSYRRAAQVNEELWHRHREEFPVPFFPNVTVGWDSSPRACQSDIYEFRGYPWLGVLDGNTPAAYAATLSRARAFATGLSANADALLTINAWNEWSEGSYLLPDEREGDSYLRATRAVLGDLATPAGRAPDNRALEEAAHEVSGA